MYRGLVSLQEFKERAVKLKHCLHQIIPPSMKNGKVLGMAGMMASMWYDIDTHDLPQDALFSPAEGVFFYVVGEDARSPLGFEGCVNYVRSHMKNMGYTVEEVTMTSNPCIYPGQWTDTFLVRIKGIDNHFVFVRCKHHDTVEAVVAELFPMDIMKTIYVVKDGTYRVEPAVALAIKSKVASVRPFMFRWGAPSQTDAEALTSVLDKMDTYTRMGYKFPSYPRVQLGPSDEDSESSAESVAVVERVPEELRHVAETAEGNAASFHAVRVACWCAIHVLEEVIIEEALDGTNVGVVGEVPLFVHLSLHPGLVPSGVEIVWNIRTLDVFVCKTIAPTLRAFEEYVWHLVEELQARHWNCTSSGCRVEQREQPGLFMSVAYIRVFGNSIAYKVIWSTWAETVQEALQAYCFGIYKVYYDFKSHTTVVSDQAEYQLQSGMIQVDEMQFNNSRPLELDIECIKKLMKDMQSHFRRGWRFSEFPCLVWKKVIKPING